MGMGSSQVLDALRGEGYKVNSGYLNYLLRDYPVLRPSVRVGAVYAWQEPDVARLRAALQDRGRGPRQRLVEGVRP